MADEMHCSDCQNWLHPYLDNEVDAATALRVHAHLQQCKTCQSSYDELQALRQGIRQAAPYFSAPDIVRQRLVAAEKKSARRLLTPVFSAAALAASIALFFMVPATQNDLTDEVVANHVRSLMEQHLTDVISSDQHTVKPWFVGKLDFTPPVHDFADQGYPLIGGRLDYLAQHNVAALVYRRNKHVINVFVQAGATTDAAPVARSERGYNLVIWKQNHLTFEAVSDLNAHELSAFAQMVADQSKP